MQTHPQQCSKTKTEITFFLLVTVAAELVGVLLHIVALLLKCVGAEVRRAQHGR